MRVMGLQAIYQAHPQHRVYPYLLKGLAIERPNQVWTADITYIPVQRGFLVPGGSHGLGHPPGALLAAVQYPRCPVLHRRPLRSPPALWPPRDLQHRPRKPVHSLEFTATLKGAGCAISMDGRGRCMDNIFIERLWRSLKYEAVYLHELSDGFQAQPVIARWMEFYNTQRPHSALADATPTETYDKGMLPQMQAKRPGSPAPLPAPSKQKDVLNRTLAA